VRTLAALAFLGVLAGARAQDPSGVIVLANRNVAESPVLAREYVAARGIPEQHIVDLDLPVSETISRGFYELRLRDPLLERLRKDKLITQTSREAGSVQPHESGWKTVKSEIQCVVSMYGVPLRIADTRPRLITGAARRLHIPVAPDSAAVDSELALMLEPAYGIAGTVANPLYNAVLSGDVADRSPRVIVAARLDGPDAGTVRRMMADALDAEQHGLHGRGYFDMQGLSHGQYFRGDHWMMEAAERLDREGYECIADRHAGVWGPLYPMEQAAVYMGWYAEQAMGPMMSPDFRFARGALAYHLHSANARTLRSTTNSWAGPLLAHGACATLGSVGEPYLGLTPNLQILTDRLCAGRSFGESAYMSIPALSWQTTVIGDPLYTPFKLSLDDQIRNLERGQRPEAEWAYLRKVNQLVREGRFNVALEYCREKIKTRDSLVLRERLGDLYAINNLYEPAAEQYDHIVAHAVTAPTAVRVGVRYLRLLNTMGLGAKAAEVERKIRASWPESPFLALLGSDER
jgi:uncharacterized protein (TIGR03790 family)